MQPDSLLKWNPDSYLSYLLAGDFALHKKEYANAARYYEVGLSKEIATEQERVHIQKNLERCKEKMK